MLTMTAEEDFETVLDNLEAQGHDMTAMRAIANDVASIPVGDPTPLPGSLLREQPSLVMPPPVHQWWTDPPEGGPPILLPASARLRKPGKRITLRGLSTEVRHLRQFVVILTMYAISATVVAVWNW